MELPKNIILAGFMGTGKTSVGRALAQRLDWQFVDSDALIELRAGCTISEIFERGGEAEFRTIEREVAAGLADLHQHVIATGGGLVLADDNRAALARAGRVILLSASPEAIWQRVRHAAHRPLLRKPDPRAEIERLLAERAPIYAQIADQVSTDGKPVRTIVEELWALLQK